LVLIYPGSTPFIKCKLIADPFTVSLTFSSCDSDCLCRKIIFKSFCIETT